MNKTKSFKLNNGIRGVIVPLPGLKSVTTEVFLKIGSKYESKGEFGLSHFLEHMAFKGTVKRPTAQQINTEIDAKGAGYNAGTGHEMTSYYVTTVKENATWAIELLSDILLNSIYDKEETKKERGVIIEEIRMYQDNPMMGLGGEFTNFLYGDSKIGCWNIAGEVNDIKNVDRKTIVDYKNKFFNPEEMVVVVCGDVDESLEGSIKDSFSGVLKNDLVLPEVKLILNKEKNKTIKKELEQGHFCMGLPALGWSDKRKHALRLLDIVMGGNSSSRLYSRIREEKALAYYVSSVGELFKEGGYWAIQSGVNLEKINEAMEIVREEIGKIAESIKEEELMRAKDYFLGKTKLAMDRTSFISSFVGQKILLENSEETIEEELEKYKKVTFKEVKDLAKEIFKSEEIRTLVCHNK
ncbi:MAG: pitrilysin family protein [Candidatus Shapirobacteria bacterium]|nr:pitrilysin family protein [Candidatus Shapirobacteria bacterium]MDD3002654.1 pitrilysin family protein [Candidatus Shapirobacteria bacterium]MDD4382835.1 pitrilysin family protein [Candidatus Shapirobacteria bacterium]